ncbi:MAG: hypothetical protein ACJAQ4_002358 [Cryomorphaceae bacterium]|jgi:hypothetical protein
MKKLTGIRPQRCFSNLTHSTASTSSGNGIRFSVSQLIAEIKLNYTPSYSSLILMCDSILVYLLDNAEPKAIKNKNTTIGFKARLASR